MSQDPRSAWRDAEPDDAIGAELYRELQRGKACPPPELIQAATAGVLPADLEARVDAHLAACALCRTLNGALDDPALGSIGDDERERILQRVRDRVEGQPTADGRGWRWAAGGVVVALLGTGALITWQSTRTGIDPQSPQVRLSGTVTSTTGEPLAGVIVAEFVSEQDGRRSQALLSPARQSAPTDASGRYSLVGVPQAPAARMNIRALKPGYFSTYQSVVIAPLMSADFRLRPLAYRGVGEVISGGFEAGAACIGVPDPCHQFAVEMPRAGMLEVELSTRQTVDLWVETPAGDVHSLLINGPRRLMLPVSSGWVCQMTVVNNSSGPAAFEVTMRVR